MSSDPPSPLLAGGVGLTRRAIFRGQAAACRRELSNLLSGGDPRGEHHVVDLFARLTADAVLTLGREAVPLWGAMSTASARCPCWPVLRSPAAPDRLKAGWDTWRYLWDLLEVRHPRLALADLLVDVGQAVNGRGWPHGREMALLDWVERGERLPLPWAAADPDAVLPENDYELLRGLRADAGGWVFHDAPSGRRVFRSDAEMAGLRFGPAA